MQLGASFLSSSHVLTTLLCIALAPKLTGFERGGYRVADVTVAIAAIDRPALERSVRRKVEANSLAVL